MEILNLHRERTSRREEVVPSFRDKKTTIRRIGLERNGMDRSYCAIFTPTENITYVGHGKGLEGNTTGRVAGDMERWKLKNTCLCLDNLNIESFADEYKQDTCTISYGEYAFPHTYFLFETAEFIKTISFYDSTESPLFFIIGSLLDDLLDSAKWREKDFSLQRNHPTRPPVKPNWG